MISVYAKNKKVSQDHRPGINHVAVDHEADATEGVDETQPGHILHEEREHDEKRGQVAQPFYVEFNLQPHSQSQASRL